MALLKEFQTTRFYPKTIQDKRRKRQNVSQRTIILLSCYLRGVSARPKRMVQHLFHWGSSSLFGKEGRLEKVPEKHGLDLDVEDLQIQITRYRPRLPFYRFDLKGCQSRTNCPYVTVGIDSLRQIQETMFLNSRHRVTRRLRIFMRAISRRDCEKKT
jgi:hypothetical protein